jgi:hypothetical protein
MCHLIASTVLHFAAIPPVWRVNGLDSLGLFLVFIGYLYVRGRYGSIRAWLRGAVATADRHMPDTERRTWR